MTRTHQLEAAITASASRHLAARRRQSGGAAPAAGVCIETMHVRYLAPSGADMPIFANFCQVMSVVYF